MDFSTMVTEVITTQTTVDVTSDITDQQTATSTTDMTTYATTLVSTTVATIVPSPTPSNLLLNPNFSTGNSDDWSVQLGGTNSLYSQAVVVADDNGINDAIFFDLDQSSTGTISQSVNTVVGTSYTVSFEWVLTNSAGANSLVCSFGSQSSMISIPYSSPIYSLTTETYTYVATASSTLFSCLAIASGGTNGGLLQVSLGAFSITQVR
jgi:hypothetical protein